jgi:hypothetical protein
MNQPAETPAEGASASLARTWEAFWFTPADSRPLAMVRFAAGGIGLLACGTYAADLTDWFGPAGLLPAETVAAWRSPLAFSVFDGCGSVTSLWVLYVLLAVLFGLLTIGLLTPVVTLLAAIGWSALLHRGPMLAGPADDCLAVLLWCLVPGTSGEHYSCDAWLHDRLGWDVARPRVRTRLTIGLLQIHAAVIAAAAVVAQLKGDVWWNGTGLWWAATREAGRLVDLTGPLLASEYLCNLLSQGIVAWELFFAIAIWFAPTQRLVARAAVMAWPVIGLLIAEPIWGLTLACFTLPLSGWFSATAE